MLNDEGVRSVRDSLYHFSERWYDITACPLGIRVCEGQYGERFFTWNLYYSYRCGISLPFTDFEMRVMDTLQVAPTQLHPNAWATLHAFQGICESFGRLMRFDVFFYFYFLKNPRKNEVGYLYFTAKRGKSLILPIEEFAKQFKRWFFWVTELPSGHSFFVNEEGKPRFSLLWPPPSSDSEPSTGKSVPDVAGGALEDTQSAKPYGPNTIAPPEDCSGAGPSHEGCPIPPLSEKFLPVDPIVLLEEFRHMRSSSMLCELRATFHHCFGIVQVLNDQLKAEEILVIDSDGLCAAEENAA
ncbi:hypothetical protein L6164_028728 [Bauhinia variegata]|uniref:Uncharacterized protein n=1 Tax=Bauhinia variegata TaxID=167791 RepID=A0ACB9L6V5_BAUVA|nr:hypothetical protein L6164_028728 [Bauhinia variegata]